MSGAFFLFDNSIVMFSIHNQKIDGLKNIDVLGYNLIILENARDHH